MIAPMPFPARLLLAGLATAMLAACATAPAGPNLTPPPPRVDAKTQLEYGAPPPRGPRY